MHEVLYIFFCGEQGKGEGGRANPQHQRGEDKFQVESVGMFGQDWLYVYLGIAFSVPSRERLTHSLRH